ncbi:MAG: hemerythrin domain-containing protein [Pseudomonadota bacterium]|nr:hemerythrin domain-containing protein [Pseudomonadota bacterium]
MIDITALILADHEWFRCRFTALDDARKADLHAVWGPLARHLETHASAEESVFCPRLLERSDEDAEEANDALRDHNKIRDAIAAADRHEVGSDAWQRHLT